MFVNLLPANAQKKQTQDALYIYRNDGGFHGFFYGEIDRFEYSKVDTLGVEHDDFVVQEIYARDTVYRIPINAIDSIGFVTPENIYKEDVAVTTFFYACIEHARCYHPQGWRQGGKDRIYA